MMKGNEKELWTRPLFVYTLSEESKRKLNATLFIAALLFVIVLCVPLLLACHAIKQHTARRIHIGRLRKYGLAPPSDRPRWDTDFRIPKLYSDGADIPLPAELAAALTAAEASRLDRRPLAPYSLANVIHAETHFLRIFGVLVYDPRTDKFIFHHSNNMRWVPASLQVVGSFKVLAEALRTLHPKRFRGGAREFALAISAGDYPCLQWNECLRRQRLDCNAQDRLGFPPILQFGSNFRRPIIPNIVSMPMPQQNHLHCYRHWAVRREVCGSYLPRTPDNPHGLVFPETIGVRSWDDLIPQVVWRGADLEYYLQKMEPDLRTPSFQEDVARKLHRAGDDVDRRTAATHAMRQVYDELTPRWKGVVLTAEAEREVEAVSGANEQQTQRQQPQQQQPGLQQRQKPVLPWANIKFDSAFYMNKKLPTSEIDDYRRFQGCGIPTVGDEMSLESLGWYKYHIDLAEGGGTSWSGTLEKLALPGLLFHHVTPTEDYLHERLVPWVHYVPVRSDLSDLREKFDWAESHPRMARQISEYATELVRGWGTPEGFGGLFEEFFEGPLRRVTEAYRPVGRGTDWRRAMIQQGGEELRPILQCGGYAQEHCDELVDDIEFARSQIGSRT